VELTPVESSAMPVFGLQPLVLSDDFVLATTAARAKALLESGSRIKHIQQAAISTILLDSVTRIDHSGGLMFPWFS